MATATLVNALLDSAEGKVLVIDEAYQLASSQYGIEALSVLVERVQGGAEDFAIILCGYSDDMRRFIIFLITTLVVSHFTGYW